MMISPEFASEILVDSSRICVVLDPGKDLESIKHNIQTVDAIACAESALNKQIPAQVVQIGDSPCCPECSKSVQFVVSRFHQVCLCAETIYCPFCGQKLKGLK